MQKKLSNKTNLPEPLVKLAEMLVNNHPVFDNSKFSVTELLKSEQQIVLARRYSDSIEQDVQDTFPMWEGTAMHNLFEQVTDTERFLSEERLEMERDGVSISGAFDLFDKETNTLYDWKNCKLAAVSDALKLTDDNKWYKQIAMYSYLLRMCKGIEVARAYIVAMCKDHSKVKARIDASYQQDPIAMVDMSRACVLPTDDVPDMDIIAESLFEKAKHIKEVLETNQEPAPCTYADMWCTEDYALIPEGKTRAIAGGVFDNEEDARAKLATANDPRLRLIHRVKEPTNCTTYCPYSDVCKQWQSMKDDFKSFAEDITDYIAF